MKKAYPIILTPDPVGYFVTIPDIDRNTQGKDVADAISMARDAICAWAMSEQDAGRPVPEPSVTLPAHKDNEIVTFVDVDFDAYRRSYDLTYVRTNVTLPRYLKRMADEHGLIYSQELQERLKERLHIE